MDLTGVTQKRGWRQRITLSGLKYAAVLRVSIANNLAYVMEVVFRTIFLVVLIFIFGQLWKTTFAARGLTSLNGFHISDLIWYLAVTETVALSLPQISRQIDQEVRSGQLAYLLGRPCNYVFYQFAQYLGERLVRLTLNSAIAFLIGLIFAGAPPFTVVSVAAWLPALFLAVCIEFVVYFSIGLLAFWTEETTPFFLIMNRFALILGGVLAPLEVLPQPIRGIAQALPFSAVYYGPARTLIHFAPMQFVWLLAQQGITLAVGSALLFALFAVARRRVSINGG